jgi:hypothetical protein
VRRATQVLGVALMAAGLTLNTSGETQIDAPAGPSDKHLTSRLPAVLFVIGAVLLVLSSI